MQWRNQGAQAPLRASQTIIFIYHFIDTAVVLCGTF